jgi:hypothetical protein
MLLILSYQANPRWIRVGETMALERVLSWIVCFLAVGIIPLSLNIRYAITIVVRA